MGNAHRLFGPRSRRERPAAGKAAPGKTATGKAAPGNAARRAVAPIAGKLVETLRQEAETAERNAETIAQVLKRALRRRRASGTGRGKVSP